jgi:hypothetical protein
MRNGLGKWSAAVHAHCLAANVGMTAEEAEQKFGAPPGNSPASKLMNSGMAAGWYRREKFFEETFSGRVIRSRFYPIDKQVRPHPQRPKNVDSYFDGLKPVRSVFELGASL